MGDVIYDKVLKPAALEYNPDMILVSAGFDIYINDPLSRMNVTPEGFAGLTGLNTRFHNHA